MTEPRQDRGFALLLIFAIAGAAAIMLYMELPRAVFESARAKEDILVERGEQYKLAIRRFYTKNRKYPQSMDELEQLNGTRFLRRRYKDPLTGEDEWRLIHIGPAGFLDSKLFPLNQQEQKEVRQSSISEGYQVGGGNAPMGTEEKGIQDVALRQRASDQNPQKFPGQEDGAEEKDLNQPPDPNHPDSTNQNASNNQSPNQNQNPNQFNPNQNGQTGSPNQPGSATGNQPGSNPALGMIQNLLTRPRQPQTPGSPGVSGGVGPMGGTQATANAQQNTFVGGIAGVASKYEGEGIKLINDRSRIDEWEFLFDYRQQTQMGTGQNNLPNGQKPGGNPGRPGPGNTGNPFPSNPGSGFGSGGPPNLGPGSNRR